MKITRGKIITPKKLVIYGPEGIGKSTFAAAFPDPVFIDTEGSTKELDVARFDPPSSWTMLIQQVQYVRDYPDVCRTLVIDTADWAEQMEIQELCSKKRVDGLEGFGYGKGYTYSAEEFGKLLNLLNEVVEKGVNVVLTAHAWLRKVELPEEMGAYDHWEMKTSKKVAPMIREWADAVFFANYKILVNNIDGQGAQKGKNKAQGGRRVMYTTHTPFWDAKNRYGLPDELPFDYSAIAHIISGSEAKTAAKAAPPEKKKEPEPPAPAPAPAPVPEPEPEAPPKSDPEPEKKTESAEQPDQGAGKPVKKETPPAVVTDETLDKRIPKRLRDLMIMDNIDAWDLENVVVLRGMFPTGTSILVYPDDFIDEWIIPNWNKVVSLARETRNNMEIPFN